MKKHDNLSDEDKVARREYQIRKTEMICKMFHESRKEKQITIEKSLGKKCSQSTRITSSEREKITTTF